MLDGRELSGGILFNVASQESESRIQASGFTLAIMFPTAPDGSEHSQIIYRANWYIALSVYKRQSKHNTYNISEWKNIFVLIPRIKNKTTKINLPKLPGASVVSVTVEDTQKKPIVWKGKIFVYYFKNTMQEIRQLLGKTKKMRSRIIFTKDTVIKW